MRIRELSLLRKTVAVILLTAVVSFAIAQDDSDVSYDGLIRVDNSKVDEAYVEPGLDLSEYTSVLIDPVTVTYKRTPRQSSSMSRGSSRSANFALSDNQMNEFTQMFQDEFIGAMSAGDDWHIVDAAAPDVLRVHAALIDLVVKVPTRTTAGRSDQFVTEFGEVTLAVELRDSQSGDILARAVDRQVLRPIGASTSRPRRATSTGARAEVRRTFRRWADLLRSGLDDVRAASASASD